MPVMARPCSHGISKSVSTSSSTSTLVCGRLTVVGVSADPVGIVVVDLTGAIGSLTVTGTAASLEADSVASAGVRSSFSMAGRVTVS